MSTTTKLPDHSDVDAARSKRIADEVADEAICLAFEGVDLILRATTPDTPEPVMTAWIGLFHGLPSNVREIRRLGSHYVSSPSLSQLCSAPALGSTQSESRQSANCGRGTDFRHLSGARHRADVRKHDAGGESMTPRDAMPQWIWVTNKDYGQILIYVSDAGLYERGHGTRIKFSSGTYLDVTESLDEIAVKIGARSAMSKATKVWEDGGQTTDRPGRRRVLRGG
jgi:hypothetical protein